MRSLRWRCDRCNKTCFQHDSTREVGKTNPSLTVTRELELIAVLRLRHMCLCLCLHPWAYAGDLHAMMPGPSTKTFFGSLGASRQDLTGFPPTSRLSRYRAIVIIPMTTPLTRTRISKDGSRVLPTHDAAKQLPVDVQISLRCHCRDQKASLLAVPVAEYEQWGPAYSPLQWSWPVEPSSITVVFSACVLWAFWSSNCNGLLVTHNRSFDMRTTFHHGLASVVTCYFGNRIVIRPPTQHPLLCSYLHSKWTVGT
jgi:hypothetical protein